MSTVEQTENRNTLLTVTSSSLCRHFRDYTWTLTTAAELNVTEQIVHCRCPKNSVTYLTKREPVANDSTAYRYLFACSPLTVSRRVSLSTLLSLTFSSLSFLAPTLPAQATLQTVHSAQATRVPGWSEHQFAVPVSQGSSLSQSSYAIGCHCWREFSGGQYTDLFGLLHGQRLKKLPLLAATILFRY